MLQIGVSVGGSSTPLELLLLGPGACWRSCFSSVAPLFLLDLWTSEIGAEQLKLMIFFSFWSPSSFLLLLIAPSLLPLAGLIQDWPNILGLRVYWAHLGIRTVTST